MSSLDDATIRARSPAKTDHAISSSTNIIRKQHEKGRLTTTLQQSREIKALTNHLARKFDKVFSRSSELLSFQRSLVLRSSNKPLFVPFHPDDMIPVHRTSTNRTVKMLSLRLEVVACPRHMRMSFVARESRGTLVSLLQMKQATGRKLL